MDINGTINVLRTMESQMGEIQEQNSRINSIQRTISNLKEEQALLKMPEKPVLQTPKSVSGFASARALGVYFLCCLIFFGIGASFVSKPLENDTDIIVGVVLGDNANIIMGIALTLSVIPAIIAGKMGEAKREELAKAEESQRVTTVNKHLLSDWEKERDNIQRRTAQITRQLVQLDTEYRTAVQVEQELQAKLSESGYSIGLHPDYWTSDALYQIRSLLDHGRADTLKEAINRYEAEERQRQVEQDRLNLEWARMQREESYRRERLEAAQRQAEAAERGAEYARQQARDTAEMKAQQEWDRLFRR